MGDNGQELSQEYMQALRDHLSTDDEASLHEAYDVGRKALTKGLGVVHLAILHHESLATILRQLPTPEQGAQAACSAAEVQAESLSVFEMALLGYREANEQLTRLNYELEEQTRALETSNERYRTLAADLEKLAATEHQERLELERIHDELKHTQSQLVQSAKLAALGQLAAGMAHEVNNPLAFVLNNLAVLQRHTRALPELIRLYHEAASLAAPHRQDLYQQILDLADQIDLPYVLENLDQLLERSRQGLKRIQGIVQDLRDFSGLDRGTFEEESDLNAGIAATLNIVRGRAALKGVEIDVDLGPLPPVICSAAKIDQVVLNLCINAIDACSKEGRVTVRTRALKDGVQIHVIDNGSGIDPSIRDKIFDPFFTTTPPGQGTGLGLSISHAIVKEAGGEITVESTPGQGAHFAVRLPLRPTGPGGERA
jgi:signal transduction histidine kinase